ncbi:alpha/beta-hydrolase [Patellaria atrata CBS 101060]|uniref:Carboxylic ester hydrolase n=1 Tax=Patellaria atrata CBS 101060 TaxID=1346257 RepID=A0A9P4S834_9PEZI|nr:alpha/beta-hydrolase [Patellaria atrata CBS 101060]
MRLYYLLSLVPFALATPVKVPVQNEGPQERAAAPTITITSPQATIIGSSLLGIDRFDGIPFAKPPTGPLRLRPPQPLTSSLGTVKATGIAKACPQFYFSVDEMNFPTNVLGTLLNTPFFQTVTNAGEDCLTLTIRRPAGTTASSKLPVLFWIFGGGFELGSTQMYDGTSLVADSIIQGKPIIFVAVNYRVGGFGFLGGSEILADGAANLGLLDQRRGLEWVAENIDKFGGDPEKVTIWGESAGAISVLDQMALYNGNHMFKSRPLFRGAIMNSGSVIPADPVDCPKAQVVYDTVVREAGCSGTADTLACLRGVDYTTFLNAANSVPGILSYSSVALSYLPRPDGVVLADSPDILISSGRYAKVPFIVGDQEDEGTLFALFQPNITTTQQLVNYFKELYFHSASPEQLATLVQTYPEDPAPGSPFRTGPLNNIYPQFKRLAAILGDLTFTLTRRAFLETAATVNPGVKSWSYLSRYNYGTPVLGTFHASDLLQVFYGILPNYASVAIHGYYFSFVYDLDPNKNGLGLMRWPEWKEGKELMAFDALSGELIKDDFRMESYEFSSANTQNLYI